MFTESFRDRCSKYSFVNQYKELSINAHARFLVFVYNEKGRKSGGFGDRMGGLVTAVANAIRFKRKLLIKSSNGFDDLFRPYPGDNNEFESFTWKNQKDWSGFATWKEQHGAYTNSNKQEWEYDLSYCVSHEESRFSDEISRQCAMDNGDVTQPVVRFASNRAYLCRWDNRTDHRSHQELRELLNIEEGDNLFEAAGCMLRLVMWPTDLLWSYVDLAYANEFRTHILEKLEEGDIATTIDADLLQSQVLEAIPLNYTMSKAPAFQFGLQYRCGDWWSYQGLKLNSGKEDPNACIMGPEDSLTSVKQNTKKSQYMHAGTPIEIGNCTYDMLNRATFHSSLDTMTSPSRAILLSPLLGEARQTINLYSFFEILAPFHTPFHVGHNTNTVDRHLFGDIAVTVEGAPVAVELSETTTSKKNKMNKQMKSNIGSSSGKIESTLSETDLNGKMGKNANVLTDFLRMLVTPQIIVFVTSDNVFGARQIREAAKGMYSSLQDSSKSTTMDRTSSTMYMLSPQGCHIDLDKSTACYIVTTTYWFILSLSDVFVTQTFGPLSAPTSAFSRFAGIYGLKTVRTPFRSGKFCGEDVVSMDAMSRFQQGNWYCE
jgi:hypothetical protein